MPHAKQGTAVSLGGPLALGLIESRHMLTLKNDQLTLSMLDPGSAVDRERQGTRYCWGGYIWQVEDAELGPLVAGPEWPHPEPSAFNGQGLPESFRSHGFGSKEPLTVRDGAGIILGVGSVAQGNSSAYDLTNPCKWHIDARDREVMFATVQTWNELAVRITRTVGLEGRSVSSATTVENVGGGVLPLHWFAHPFFALSDGLVECQIPGGWSIAENDGFALDSRNALRQTRRFDDQFDGHFEELTIQPGVELDVRVSHSSVATVAFAADFVPDRCPVWGNSNTWSIEPYIETELDPGGLRSWALTYRF